MRRDLQTRLLEDFPDLYCRGLHIACGGGWEPLLRRLSERITQIVQSLPLESPSPADEPSISDQRSTEAGQYAGLTAQSFCANQVKEKYGGLRFYMNKSTDEIRQAIQDAKAESVSTCETCGRSGKLRDAGWWFVACDEHNGDAAEAIKFWV